MALVRKRVFNVLTCVAVIAARSVNGAYFDMTGVVGSSIVPPFFTALCVSSAGLISSPTVDAPLSIASNAGPTTGQDLLTAVFISGSGTCAAGTLALETANVAVPHCQSSGGVDLIVCVPGASTVIRCSEGDILWVGVDQLKWTSSSPKTDGLFVGLSGIYPTASDGYGALVDSEFMTWGVIDEDVALASQVSPCQCGDTRCEISALQGYRCADSSRCQAEIPNQSPFASPPVGSNNEGVPTPAVAGSGNAAPSSGSPPIAATSGACAKYGVMLDRGGLALLLLAFMVL